MTPLLKFQLGGSVTACCHQSCSRTCGSPAIGAPTARPHNPASPRHLATQLHALNPHRHASSSPASAASVGGLRLLALNNSLTPATWPQLGALSAVGLSSPPPSTSAPHRAAPSLACMSQPGQPSRGTDGADGDAADADPSATGGSSWDASGTADPSADPVDGPRGVKVGRDAGGRGGGNRGGYRGARAGRRSGVGSAQADAEGPFYAVAAGWKAGVFRSWNEAKASVEGFSGAVYKKFGTEAEAQQFVQAVGGTRAGAGGGSPPENQWPAPGAGAADPGAAAAAAAGELPGPHYAVVKGRKVGVMRTWEDTRAAVDGVSGAVFKRFNTRSEAEAFIALQHRHPATSKEDPSPPPPPPPPPTTTTTPSATVPYTSVLPPPSARTPSTSAADAGVAAGSGAAYGAGGGDGGDDGGRGGGAGAAPATSSRTAEAPIRTTPPREYYAVAKGWQPGVYTCWGDAAAAVEGFSGGVYRKFKSLVGAQAFVAEGGAPPRRRKSRAAAAGASTAAAAAAAPAAGGGAAADGAISDADEASPEGAEEEGGEGQDAAEAAAAAAEVEYGGVEAVYDNGLPYGSGGGSAGGGGGDGVHRGLRPREQRRPRSVRQKVDESKDPSALLGFESLVGRVNPALQYRLEFDGGSRHNPGDAGFGTVLVDTATGRHVEYVAGPLEGCSNNVAEWTALAAGLQVAIEMGVRHLVVQGDSELVCRQVSGTYGVNHVSLRPLAARVAQLRMRLESFQVVHVPRARNTVADVLSNLAMDAEALVAEAVYDSTGSTADVGEQPHPTQRLSAELRGIVGELGEHALQVARKAVAAAAAASPSPSVLTTTTTITTSVASADSAARPPPVARPGRGRPRKAPQAFGETSGALTAATGAGGSGGGSGSGRQISVQECRPPLAARGSVAGSLVEFNRVLIALAFAGRGLLD